MEDYEEYAKQARLLCDIHARPKAEKVGSVDVEGVGERLAASGSDAVQQQQKKQRPGKEEQTLLDKKKLEKKKSLKRL